LALPPALPADDFEDRARADDGVRARDTRNDFERLPPDALPDRDLERDEVEPDLDFILISIAMVLN